MANRKELNLRRLQKKLRNAPPTTVPQVYIIESLGLEDEQHRKEGEVLSRTLRISGKSPRYEYIRTRDEFLHFIDDFEKSKYRYLHLSCHGNEDRIGFTFGEMSVPDLVELLAPVLKGRRLFISACDIATLKLAKPLLLKQRECHSVVGPTGEVAFSDSTILWSAFYHVMFKSNKSMMSKKDISENLSKVANLTGQSMTLFTRDKSEVKRDYCV